MEEWIPSIVEKFVCAQRELTRRLHAYPRLVKKGQMSNAQVYRELMLMQAIVADYEEAATSERLHARRTAPSGEQG